MRRPILALPLLLAAAPLPAATPTCPADDTLARDMLAQVNQVRGRSRTCAGNYLTAAPPLVWSDTLAQAARRHAADMAGRDAMGHSGSDGSDAWQRLETAGYTPLAGAENLAAGYPDVAATLARWADSPTHCANLMDPIYTQIGAACATARGSEYGTYWVLELAAPLE